MANDPGTSRRSGNGDSARILITFGRSFLTLHLARLLAAAGHEVMIADSMKLPVGRFSNAVSRVFRVPAPRFDPHGYGRELARIAADESIDLIIPMHEETYYLSMQRELFPATTKLFLSDFRLENQLHNKVEFQKLLVDRSVPVMKFAEVRSQQELDELDMGDLTYALKQSYSRGSAEVYKVRPGEKPTGLKFEADNPWIAQEWVDGRQYCSYSVCHEGRVLAEAIYPVRYAIDGSSSLTFEQTDHQGISDWIAELVKDVGFTGQIGFDFIDSPERGLLSIECNPRSTSGILMFDRGSGIDKAFLGTATELVTPRPDVRRMIGPGMMLYGWRKSSLPGNTWRSFWRDYRATDEIISDRQDGKPVVCVPLALANISLHALKYHVTLPEAFLYDHDWDGTPI